MEMSARKPLLPRRVLDLPIDALRPNPNQPRIEFDEASLRSLSDSIRRYGILQPLTVRRTDEGYELIAGERRLRAAKLAGLREVPCLLARSSEEESALLALILIGTALTAFLCAKNHGKLNLGSRMLRLFPDGFNPLLFYFICVLWAVVLAACLIFGSGFAFYAMFAAIAVELIGAVYYTFQLK